MASNVCNSLKNCSDPTAKQTCNEFAKLCIQAHCEAFIKAGGLIAERKDIAEAPRDGTSILGKFTDSQGVTIIEPFIWVKTAGWCSLNNTSRGVNYPLTYYYELLKAVSDEGGV